MDFFEADRDAAALLIHCTGRVAGGDISTFDAPDFSAQLCNATRARIGAQGRPLVAALHGTVPGGGLELVRRCDASREALAADLVEAAAKGTQRRSGTERPFFVSRIGEIHSGSAAREL